MTDPACPVCASPLPRGNAFCGACGARLPATGTEPRADALIGRVLDSRFRILRLIGTGGMGAVYLAEHVGIGKQVAIKVLRADLRSQPDLVGRFRREAMAVSKLTDPHTITVFDFGVWRGLIYLVMEYLRGADLAVLIDREGRLSAEAALSVALAVLSSLAEAHDQGIVHRDLKPENIYITRAAGGDELIKVLDFGLAKMMTAPEQRTDAGFQTREGALLGTPYFMAPEQISGDDIDGRCDLYAVGALLFLMVTGRHPYASKNPMRVLEAHLAGDLPTLASVAPGVVVPDGFEALVRDLMAVDPAARPPNALAVIERLRGLSAGTATGERAATVTPPEGAPVDAPASEPPQSADTDRDAAPPSAFSTSVLLSHADWGDVLDDALPASLTRDEFAGYERGLRFRGVFRTVLALLALAGLAGGGGWLYLRQANQPLTEEVEPNHEPRLATPLTLGVPMTGFIGARQHDDRSDRDVYRLTDAGGDAVTLSVTGVPRIDLIVEGFNTEGERLFEVNAAGAGEAEAIHDLRVSADPLYLSVREVWVQGQPPGENSTDPYTLTVSLQAAP